MPYKLRKNRRLTKRYTNYKKPQKSMSSDMSSTEVPPNSSSMEDTSSTTNPLTKPQDMDSITSIHDRLDTIVSGLTSHIDNLKSDLTASIKTETQSIQNSLDGFKADMESKFDAFKTEIKSTVRTMESDIETNKSSAESAKKRMEIMDAEILQLQIDQNASEQWNRNHSVKIKGFKVPSGSVGRAVYNAFIIPTLEYANIAKAEEDKLPTYYETCQKAHILQSKPGQIPTIQFRFTTREVRDEFMENKKAIIESYNKKFSTRVEFHNDYTATNKLCMTALYNDDTVDRFWLAGTTIKFVLKSDLQTALQVKNPLANTVSEMVKSPI